MSTQEERFAQIAAAIREKDGTTAPIRALDFAERIRAIQTGGGGCGFAVPLVVTVEAGATVTATHGETTVTATSGTDGTATLVLTAPGVWGVTAALGDKEKSTEIEVIDGYSARFMLSAKLPDGYTEVEYIKSANKCSIDTGFNVNFSTSGIVMDIEADAYVTGNEYLMAMNPASSKYFNLVRKSESQMTYRWYSYGISTADVDITGKRTIINWDFPNAKLNIGTDSFTTPKADYTMSSKLYLLRIASSTAAIANSICGKIYSAQIYTNETIQRDFVPCINPSGAAGLFDLVEEKFYPNAGTGAFTPGPAV